MHELRATYFLHSATHRVQDWHRVQYWHRFQDNALTRVDWYKENKCFALSTRDRPFNLKGGACFFSILVRLNSATIFLWRVVRYNIFSPNYMYHYFISYKISIRISVSSKYIIKKKHTQKKIVPTWYGNMVFVQKSIGFWSYWSMYQVIVWVRCAPLFWFKFKLAILQLFLFVYRTKIEK